MADSLNEISREVRLYAPDCPIELIRRWGRDRFRKIVSLKDWSWLLAEDQFTFPAKYSTGTISLTNASTDITGSETVWTSAMTGRQLKVNDHMFTFTYASGTTGTIDRAWPEDDASDQSYSILKAYVTVPSAFASFHTIVDPQEGSRLRFDLTGRQLDAVDPQRSEEGTPSVLAAIGYSSDATPLPRFEVWPHVIDQRGLRFLYYKKVTDFSTSQALPYWVDGEIVKQGVLADLCRWPGTRERPNLMFNVKNALDFEAKFNEGLGLMWTRDEDIYLSNFWYEAADLPLVPFSAKFWQNRILPE